MRQIILDGWISRLDIFQVQFTTKAVLGHPTMQSPIAHSLGWPERLSIDLPKLNLSDIGELTFRPIDCARFPCFKLAESALATGHGAQITLNAANEVAVAAFLDQKIDFYAINHHIEQQLTNFGHQPVNNIDDVFALDQLVRSQELNSSQ